MNKRISICKKAFGKGRLTPVECYFIDKDVYDNFKTELEVSECTLEVKYNKNNENGKNYLYFDWDLKIENPSSIPIGVARFIFSGKKGENLEITVMEDDKINDDFTIKQEIEVIDDDCLIEINLKKELRGGDKVKLSISYAAEHNFNRKCERIWLVPDALGFANMKKFCIRFYGDEDYVHKRTNAKLKYYDLDKEYKEKTDYKVLKYKSFEEGKKG